MQFLKIYVMLMLFMLCGCTHIKYLMFAPDYDSIYNDDDLENNLVPLKNMKTKLIFCQGKFSTIYKDNQVLTHQKIGIHTYNYLPGTPVKDVIFNGLGNLFTQSGQQWNTTQNNSDIRVDVNFKSLHCADFNEIIGYNAKTDIIAKIDFYSVKKDSLIYSNEYIGLNSNTYKKGLIIDDRLRNRDGENLTVYSSKIPFSPGLNCNLLYESVNFSFVNLMFKIGKDPYLKKALENYSSSKKK